ncbi:MAG: phosphoglycerate kinase [Thermoplasmatota archaeon]
MAKPYFTLDDLPLSGATVLLRVDINSPIQSGRIAGTDRIEAAAETVDALAGKGARVVILAHQGRKGDPDYTSLREHAQVLGKVTKAKVSFVEDIAGPTAIAAIKGLPAGHAVMLENVRGLEEEGKKGSPEEHAKASFVATLASVSQFYVNDAFSAAHRSQASLVGFPLLLPSAAGITMDRELTALSQAIENPEAPAVYFLGGAKPEDSMAVMEHNFRRETLDLALLGGLVGELFMVARGQNLGPETMDLLKRRGLLEMLPRAKALLDAHDELILTPMDVAVRDGKGNRIEIATEELPAHGLIQDIGKATIAAYEEAIADAGSLMMNGPAGLYEEPHFDVGTKAILRAFARADAFSLMGGGHTTTAIHKFGMSFDDYGYVSLAGGALMGFLTGEKLPAVEALNESKRRFEGRIRR